MGWSCYRVPFRYVFAWISRDDWILVMPWCDDFPAETIRKDFFASDRPEVRPMDWIRSGTMRRDPLTFILFLCYLVRPLRGRHLFCSIYLTKYKIVLIYQSNLKNNMSETPKFIESPIFPEDKVSNLFYALELFLLKDDLEKLDPEFTRLFEDFLKSFEMVGSSWKAPRELLERALEEWKTASLDQKNAILQSMKEVSGGVTYRNILLRLGSSFDSGKILTKIHDKFTSVIQLNVERVISWELNGSWEELDRGLLTEIPIESLKKELPGMLMPYIDSEVQFQETQIMLSPQLRVFKAHLIAALPDMAKNHLANMVQTAQAHRDSRFQFLFSSDNHDYQALLKEFHVNRNALNSLKNFHQEMHRLNRARTEEIVKPVVLSSESGWPDFYSL